MARVCLLYKALSLVLGLTYSAVDMLRNLVHKEFDCCGLHVRVPICWKINLVDKADRNCVRGK